MSVEALTWSLKVTTGNPGRKAILITLANYSDKDGFSYPGQKHLAEITEQSERTVRAHLAKLEKTGLITREERRRADGSRTTDGYWLTAWPGCNPPEGLEPRTEPDPQDTSPTQATPTEQPAESAGSHQPAESAGTPGEICRAQPAESAGRDTKALLHDSRTPFHEHPTTSSANYPVHGDTRAWENDPLAFQNATPEQHLKAKAPEVHAHLLRLLRAAGSNSYRVKNAQSTFWIEAIEEHGPTACAAALQQAHASVGEYDSPILYAASILRGSKGSSAGGRAGRPPARRNAPRSTEMLTDQYADLL